MQYIENPNLCDDYHWMDLSSISNQYIKELIEEGKKLHLGNHRMPIIIVK